MEGLVNGLLASTKPTIRTDIITDTCDNTKRKEERRKGEKEERRKGGKEDLPKYMQKNIQTTIQIQSSCHVDYVFDH